MSNKCHILNILMSRKYLKKISRKYSFWPKVEICIRYLKKLSITYLFQIFCRFHMQTISNIIDSLNMQIAGYRPTLAHYICGVMDGWYLRVCYTYPTHILQLSQHLTVLTSLVIELSSYIYRRSAQHFISERQETSLNIF